MADPRPRPHVLHGATGVIVFADGRTVWGRGFGAEGSAVGELCFNTAMTGYQEVMTDPSYARQMVAFTFPHIGNVGANEEDVEAGEAHALGCVVREAVTSPSNFRSTQDFPSWMAATGRIGVSGVDTRALTRLVRREGPPSVAFAHDAKGEFDLAALQKQAAEWPGLEGMDLAKEVSREQLEAWSGGKWRLGEGYEERLSTSLDTNGLRKSAFPRPVRPERSRRDGPRPHVVAIDYGSKHNIFRNLVAAGARVTIVPAGASFDEVMVHEPDGFFLSNGPGDPAATGEYAVPLIKAIARHRQAAVRDLPWPSIACARGRRKDRKDVPGPPRRQPPGQALRRWRGRDHQHEPRLRGRARGAPRQRPRNPRQPVRRQQLRARTDRQASLFGPVPPRGEPGAAWTVSICSRSSWG